LPRKYQKEIRADSVGTVETVGLLGDSYVDISRGTPARKWSRMAAAIKTAEKIDITRIGGPQLQRRHCESARLSSKLDDITEQSAVRHRERWASCYTIRRRFTHKMSATTGSLQAMVDPPCSAGMARWGKLMSDETLYNRTVATIDRLNQVLDDVQHGKPVNLGQVSFSRSRRFTTQS